MNKSADPCLDFYAFSCGTWLRDTAAPATEAFWNRDAQMTRLRDAKLRDILESPIDTYHHVESAERKVKLFYQKCLNDSPLEEDLGVFMDAINAVGGWAVKGKRAKKGGWFCRVWHHFKEMCPLIANGSTCAVNVLVF